MSVENTKLLIRITIKIFIMKYLRPRLPDKEVELCLELFDKQEAKNRLLKYIKGVFDDAESQFNNALKILSNERETVRKHEGNGERCPVCGSVKIFPMYTKEYYNCLDCGHDWAM